MGFENRQCVSMGYGFHGFHVGSMSFGFWVSIGPAHWPISSFTTAMGDTEMLSRRQREPRKYAFCDRQHLRENSWSDRPISGGNVELLLANKAGLNAKNIGGFTPLHFAAQNGHNDTVVFLLAQKAELNAKSKSGATPTRLAMFQAHKELAELLRQRGGHE
jgi:ankyrin repeat protein